MWTPIPPTSRSPRTISPVWIAARISSPDSPSDPISANAQRSARVGASNVARMPSPVVLTRRPWNRSTSARASRSCRSIS